MKALQGESALTRVDMPSLVAAGASAQSAVENARTIEFLYLDQEAVLAADLLNMRRAMRVVGQRSSCKARFVTRTRWSCGRRTARNPKIRAASMHSSHPSAAQCARWA